MRWTLILKWYLHNNLASWLEFWLKLSAKSILYNINRDITPSNLNRRTRTTERVSTTLRNRLPFRTQKNKLKNTRLKRKKLGNSAWQPWDHPDSKKKNIAVKRSLSERIPEPKHSKIYWTEMALLNSQRNQKPNQHRQTSLTRKHQPRYGKRVIPGKRTNCTQIELNNEPTKKLNNQANTFSVVENPYINHQSCVLPSFHIFWRGLVSLVTGCSLDKTVTSSYTDPPHNKPNIANSWKTARNVTCEIKKGTI